MSEETKYQKLKGDPQLCYHNNRGIEKCEAGEFDEGIAEFNQAIQLSPKLSVPYFNRAIAFQSIGLSLSAAADIQMAKLLIRLLNSK